MVKVFAEEDIHEGDLFKAIVTSRGIVLFPLCRECRQSYHPAEGRHGKCLECWEEEEKMIMVSNRKTIARLNCQI